MRGKAKGQRLKAKGKGSTSLRLIHVFTERGGRWLVINKSGEEVFATGSSVNLLGFLKRVEASIPDVLCGPACWETEYEVELEAAR